MDDKELNNLIDIKKQNDELYREKLSRVRSLCFIHDECISPMPPVNDSKEYMCPECQSFLKESIIHKYVYYKCPSCDYEYAMQLSLLEQISMGLLDYLSTLRSILNRR